LKQMREKIKILDGPLEGEETYIDRRLMKLYDDHIIVDQDTDNKYRYRMYGDGLKFVNNA